MSPRALVATWSAACSLFALTASGGAPTNTSAKSAATPGCFASGEAFLRARLRGALDLSLDWKNADMECAGGPRPGKQGGIRVSIGGPVRGDGRRIRLIFGIAGVGENTAGTALPTNVTLLFEGENRVFATQGDEKCTVDTLSQQRVETLGDDPAVYRVVARGFCLGPASSLTQGERVFLTRFDFAARVEFGDDDRHALRQTP